MAIVLFTIKVQIIIARNGQVAIHGNKQKKMNCF